MSDKLNPQNEQRLRSPRSHRWELWAAGAFALVHILAPFTIGEKYPFTVAPMFRDQPKHYCVYEVLDPQGKRLDLEAFGLHLVYDGNPVGLGVGIEARPTLHSFGEIPEETVLLDHVRERLSQLQIESVELRQTVVTTEDHKVVERDRTWEVYRIEESE